MKNTAKKFIETNGVRACAAVFLSVGQLASAQSVLEEVVVSAQKREQSIQEVGISISAFDGDTIDALGFQSAVDIVNQVPNLTLRDAGTVPLIAIRGNSLIDFGDGNETPVGFYIDEVYRSTVSGQQAQLFDLERIEVLRGPQGTLYGRNTTAGLIHFISRKPTDTSEGYFNIQAGSFNQLILEGALSGPLSESARGRIAFTSNTDGGWQDNKGSGGGNFAETDIFAARGQLELDFSDRATMLLSATYSEQNNVSNGYGFLGVLDPVTFEQCTPSQTADGDCINLAGFQEPDPDSETVYSEQREPGNDIDILDLSAKLSWQLTDNVELVSITAYEELDRFLEVDEDSSDTGVFGGAFQFLDQYGIETETFTQEIRLQGNWNEHSDWLAGFFYFKDDKDPITSTVKDLEFPIGTPDTVAGVETTSWAMFAHLDKKLSDSLSLIAGIRYTEDEKDAVITSGGASASPSLETESWTGELGLNWYASGDLMVYGSASRGFKSGEFNTTLLFGDLSGATAADEETVLAYEVGAKWEFGEGRGRLNMSAFYQDIEDKQGTTIPGNSPVPTTRLINFGDVDVYGAEFELFYQSTEHLEIILGLALLDTKISSDPATGVISNWGAGANGGEGDFFSADGNELPQAADLTVNGIIRYGFELGENGSSTLQADFSWTDDQAAFGDNPFNEIDAYGLLNLRAFWESASGRYNATVFVENVLDEDVQLNKFFLGGFDYQAVQWGKPRWFGAKVGISF
jgi:iron complex outermembrane receptor protein